MAGTRRSLGRRLCATAIAAILSAGARASPPQDYMLHCMGCHGATAEGVPGKVPPLARTLIQYMRSAEGRSYVLRVPGASNSTLSDAQLAAVLNWVAARFGAEALPQSAPPFTPEEVSSQRHSAMASVQATRRAVLQQLAATGDAPPENY